MKIQSLSALSCMALAIALPLLSAPAQTPQTANPKIEYSKEDIMSTIDSMYNKMKSEKTELVLQPTEFVVFAQSLKEFTEYPELEKVTKIKKDWFVKLGKIVTAMDSCRTNLKVATMNKDRDLYIKSKQYYDKCFKAFEETYQDPPKIKVNR